MNKVTLVAKIAEKSGLSKKQAEQALGAFIDSVTEALKEGDKVITAGGLYGIIRTVKQDSVLLEVATNVVIKVDKRSIAANVSKSGTPENQK